MQKYIFTKKSTMLTERYQIHAKVQRSQPEQGTVLLIAVSS